MAEVTSNTTASTDNTSASTAKRRIASIDIYRGLVMTLMLLEMTEIERFSHEQQGSIFWSFIHYHTSHVEWFGCSLHDLIQPGFTFLVGTAMAFSLASRLKKGQSWGRMFLHALWRSILLISLGIFLRSLGKEQTNFTFDDTLTQIGLGYLFLFVIASLPHVVHVGAIAVLLIGYWGLFVSYPLPGPDFSYEAVGVPDTWSHHRDGLAAHFNKNSNLAWAFDRWWMNLFPRPAVFEYARDNYATLSFIPTLATMLLGLLAGQWLRDIQEAPSRIWRFVAAIVLCAVIALVVDYFNICPIVKKIWTPAWTLYSGAWCFAFLLFFHLIADIRGWVAWSFPLRVIGANSIAAYVMSWTLVPWIKQNINLHFEFLFSGLTESGQELLIGSVTFVIVWLILYWMYRRAILLRI